MEDNELVELVKKIEQNCIDTKRGIQLNIQFFDDYEIEEHKSPLLKCRLVCPTKGGSIKLYANDEYWEKKNYLTKL
ncbi:MAG: hypothetical protein KKA61_02530 [Nanoarchaeota archaeon]|nr:hypothetical protein [Nanoarchaeota archaeon]MBU4493222.1 hypothetical protein [Nanoarchaeota archaeon]